MNRFWWIFILFFLFGFVCLKQVEAQVSTKGESQMTIKISSPAFQNGGMIPQKYTCDGVNLSPPLEWSGVPENALSLALINDDPDAPVGTWVHWVLFNLPPSVSSLAENVPPLEKLDNGGIHGKNDFGKLGYGGPCPPSGTHRYFFKLYALDTKLDFAPGARKDQLLKAMKGHILAEGELIGAYKRP